MLNIRKISLMLFFFSLLLNVSGEQKQYRASWLNPAPVISGKVYDDPAWKDITFREDFIELASKDKVNGRLKFLAGFTAEGLNIRVETPWKSKEFAKDSNFFDKDTVEIFLATSTDEYSYRQFVLNIEGKRWNAKYEATRRTGADKLLEWTGTVNESPDGLIFNFLIPFKTLENLPPEGKTHWMLNVAAHETGTKDKFYSWSNLTDRFHEPRHFGKLTAENLPEDVQRQLQTKMMNWNRANAAEFLKKQAEKLREYINAVKSPNFLEQESRELDAVIGGLDRKLNESEFKVLQKRFSALLKSVYVKVNRRQQQLHEEIMTKI
jgi:hypothetical protein